MGLNALFVAAGLGVLAGLRGFASWAAVGSTIGLSHMIGLALVTLIATELLVIGAGIGVWTTVGLSLGLLVVGVAVGRLRRLPFPSRFRIGEGDAGSSPVFALLGVVPAVLTILLLLIVIRFGFVRGLIEWDAWAFWVPKGMSIFESGHLDKQFFLSTAAPSYPIAMPTLDALAFHFMGSADSVTLHTQYAFISAGFVFAVVGLLRPTIPRLYVWPFLGIVLMAADLRYFVVAPMADLPLDYFFALGFLCLALWLQQRAAWKLVLTGLLFAAAIATKREGALFVACVLVAMLVATLPDLRRRWPGVIIVGAVAWAVNLPWRSWWQSHGIADQTSPVSIHHLFATADRILPSARIVLDLAFDTNRWLIVIPLGLAAGCSLLLSHGARRLAVFYLASMVTLGAALVWILWSIPGLRLDTSDQTPIPRAIGALMLATAAITPLLVDSALRAQKHDAEGIEPKPVVVVESTGD